MKSKVSVIVFLALLAGLSILNLATPSKAFSENENRYLQQMPAFSIEALLNGKFTAGFDQFIIDQFVFRDSWVGMKTLSELTLQKRISNGIYFAKDHYLIEMFDSLDHVQYAKNLDIIGDFTDRVQDGLGVTAHTMLVPTPSMALSDKLPDNAPEVDQRALFMQADQRVEGLVDISSVLGRHSTEYIFYKTDHHWTSLGAYYAYEAWRQQAGMPAGSIDDYNQEILSDSFYGTTYSKASLYSTPPDTITAFFPKNLGAITVEYNDGQQVTDTIYERSYLDKKDKYSVFFNANQPVTHITTGVQNGKKLLIIKDSYANTFAQLVLKDYEEVYMIDLRYFKLPVYTYVEENDITDLLILYGVKGFSGDTNLYYLTI